MLYYLPKNCKLDNRWFALQELGLLGYMLSPLFEEYEDIRIKKSNSDVGKLKEIMDNGIDASNILIMCIPTKIEKLISKNDNEYYKLYILDEYSSFQVSLFKKDYNLYCKNLELMEPIMIRVNVKNGFASCNYLKEAKRIIKTRSGGYITVSNLINQMKLERYGESPENDILTKMLQEVIRGEFTLISKGYPKIGISPTYKWIKFMRNNGYEINIYEGLELPKPINVICGLETEEDCLEYKEEIEQLNN